MLLFHHMDEDFSIVDILRDVEPQHAEAIDNMMNEADVGSLVFEEMRSEDGTNFLQGVAVADVLTLKSGHFGRLLYVYVSPQCRNIGFGSVLISHARNELEGRVKALYGDEAVLKNVAMKVPKSAENLQALVKSAQKSGWQVEERARFVQLYVE